MRNLGKIIIESGVADNRFRWTRKTARAIIYKDKKVLLVYSDFYNDYTFPGGGVRKNESYSSALQRELSEEVGAKQIKIIGAYGQTLEYRKDYRSANSNYRQLSKYFLVEVLVFGKQKLEPKEVIHGVNPVWISPQEALTHNQMVMNDETHSKPGLATALKRENLVLERLIEEGY